MYVEMLRACMPESPENSKALLTFSFGRTSITHINVGNASAPSFAVEFLNLHISSEQLGLIYPISCTH